MIHPAVLIPFILIVTAAASPAAGTPQRPNPDARLDDPQILEQLRAQAELIVTELGHRYDDLIAHREEIVAITEDRWEKRWAADKVTNTKTAKRHELRNLESQLNPEHISFDIPRVVRSGPGEFLEVERQIDKAIDELEPSPVPGPPDEMAALRAAALERIDKLAARHEDLLTHLRVLDAHPRLFSALSTLASASAERTRDRNLADLRDRAETQSLRRLKRLARRLIAHEIILELQIAQAAQERNARGL